MSIHRGLVRGVIAVSLSCAVAHGAPRDLKFHSVDIGKGIVELVNTGTSPIELDGFQFCSHDDNQTFIYSNGSGLNGVTVAVGNSLFVHMKNDAAGAGHINASKVGSFAGPLDVGPFSIGIYFPPVSFGNGNAIADHIQWSVDGVDNNSADERSDEAEAGGVWANQSKWIVTAVDTAVIRLKEGAGQLPHQPEDYEAVASQPDCNANGIPDAEDISSGTAQDCNVNTIPDSCDITSGVSKDCDASAVPDSCEIASGASKDCDANGIPDACDLSAGTGKDCNGNAVPDSCDIAGGTSQDTDGDGIPDECKPTATLFARGDPNQSGQADLSDAVFIFNFLFTGGATPTCTEAANINNDAKVDISDGIALLNFLFQGGGSPAAPFPACGTDPDAPGSAGDLGCVGYSKC